MTGTIKLIDGTEFSGSVVNDDNILWLDIVDQTLPVVCESVLDPENIKTVVVHEYGVINTYEGFTHTFSLREIGGNTVNVGIEKGES